MPEGMDGWTSFPDHLPIGWEIPKRMEFKSLRDPIKEALKDRIHGWTAMEETINDILDNIVDLVELK